MIDANQKTPKRKKRKTGIPTGNAGEYFVMGELLRRGYDAQLADRNTKGYAAMGRRRLTQRPIMRSRHRVGPCTVCARPLDDCNG
jgi:hypothetical protein